MVAQLLFLVFIAAASIAYRALYVRARQAQSAPLTPPPTPLGAPPSGYPLVTAGARQCPGCRGTLIPILYGLPAGPVTAAVEFGGCIAHPDSPNRRCLACGQLYRSESVGRQKERNVR